MDERHQNEQYFFDDETLNLLRDFVSAYESPCCVCAPLQHLADAGVSVTILDIDERFQNTPGFRRFDIARPDWLGLEFDLIDCDPPFFNLSLSQLFAAIRTLARNDFRQPVLVSYLDRRASAFQKAFADFALRPTGFFPGFRSVQDTEKNRIQFFSNLTDNEISRLAKN